MPEINTEIVGDPAIDLPLVTPELTVEESAIAAQFTAEDLAKAREQEKQKLYPKIDKLQEELASLKKDREEREAVEAERRARRQEREAENARKKQEKAEEELSFKQLLKKKESELQAQLDAERSERERAFALLEREREFQELQAYRQQRLEQESENIIPELIDLIQGNNADEIEASIAALQEKSARIFDSVAQASQQSRSNLVGARVTAPASGPLDNETDSLSVTPDNLRNMSLSDYAKNRERLLGSASNNRGQGLFG